MNLRIQYRRRWWMGLMVAVMAWVLLIVNAGCQRGTYQSLHPTSVPNLTPMRERDLSLIICQESDFPPEWTMDETITTIPSQAAFPEEIVSYYGVVFDNPEMFGGAGCHIQVYGDEATAHRAFEVECSESLPSITLPEVGEEACAFRYEIGAAMVTAVFRQQEAVVVIRVGNLSDADVWAIVEAVDGRLR